MDGVRIVFQIKFFASCREQDKGKEQKRNAKEEIADEAPSLRIDEHDADEEGRKDDHGQIDVEAKRHDPRRERGADVRTHNDGDGLGKGQ